MNVSIIVEYVREEWSVIKGCGASVPISVAAATLLQGRAYSWREASLASQRVPFWFGGGQEAARGYARPTGGGASRLLIAWALGKFF